MVILIELLCHWRMLCSLCGENYTEEINYVTYAMIQSQINVNDVLICVLLEAQLQQESGSVSRVRGRHSGFYISI